MLKNKIMDDEKEKRMILTIVPMNGYKFDWGGLSVVEILGLLRTAELEARMMHINFRSKQLNSTKKTKVKKEKQK